MDKLDSIENEAHRALRREKRRTEKVKNISHLLYPPNKVVQERQWRKHMLKTLPDVTIVKRNLV